MTPGARLQAAIELLDEIEGSQAPADSLIEGYFRRRRYAGSKDRRSVADTVYGLLRRRARLSWWAERSGVEPSPRTLAIAAATVDGGGAEAARALFDGSGYGPTPLSGDEAHLVAALDHTPLDHPDMPACVALEFPCWLEDPLVAVFGGDLEAALSALNQPATVDLRSNAIKVDRDTARHALAEDGITATPTDLSPLGLRLDQHRKLGSTEAYRSGLVEVQDEGSQLVALLTAAEPGMTVIDFCAGAGGKALALAAAVGNHGRVLACDVEAARLERLEKRRERARAHCIATRTLCSEDDPWVVGQAGMAERVLLDVPCSGTGTWRRTPEAKWRLTPERLADLSALQGRILDSAARLVAPGGRLIYATCSLLGVENEGQVERFLTSQPGFAPLPVTRVWSETIGGNGPDGDPWLRLAPHSHGTDGFFVAILEREMTP